MFVSRFLTHYHLASIVDVDARRGILHKAAQQVEVRSVGFIHVQLVHPGHYLTGFGGEQVKLVESRGCAVNHIVVPGAARATSCTRISSSHQ